MGFFDTMKKGAELAKKGAGVADEALKRAATKMTDEQLKNADSSNKYIREELTRRGL